MFSRCILGLYLNIFFNICYVTCGRNSSLTFVIDDTRSMGDDIDQVIAAAEEIMDIVTREKASEIQDVVLVTFNDPEVLLRTKTTNKYELLSALKRIKVRNINNRDCPEYALSGIKRALQESRHGSYLYVFTDASAKDYFMLNEIKSLCEKKQSQVVFVLTGDCYNPDNQRYLVYHEIAKASMGQVFRIDKNEVKDVINTVKQSVKGKKSVVTSQFIPAYNNWVPVKFLVDDKTEYVLVSVSGSLVDLVIKHNTYGVVPTEKILWKPSGKMVKFIAPTPGAYYAWVTGQTDISIIVYGRTDIAFDHGFSQFVPTSLADTSKQPIADQKHHLSISITDPDNAVDIKTAEILDMAERVVVQLPLKKTGGDFYITEQFVSPSNMFKIQVTGIIKQTGTVIKRISKTAIEPQIPPKPVSKAPEVAITEGTKVDIDYNGQISLTCKVSAYPEPTIVWTSADGTVLSSRSSAVDLPYDYISYLKQTNIKKPETYYCKATNDQARNKFSKIDVIPKSPFVIGSTLAGTTQTKYGEERKLRCDVTSRYPTQIKWNTPLNPSDYTLSSDNKELTIKSVNLRAQGTYTCVTTLKSDPNQKHVETTNVVISDLAAPTISVTSSDIGVTKYGERLEISCKVSEGIPRPSINWQVMKTVDSLFKDLSVTGEDLIIDNANLDDAGQYRCIVKNAAGQAAKTIRVIVNKAPWILIEEGSKINITYGSTAYLTCKIVAHPLPKLAWLDSKGNKLPSMENINHHEVTSRLQIKAIKNSGTYFCHAENGIGNNVSNIDITVSSPFDVQGHPGATTNSLYGKPTDITCNIKSAFPLRIKWFYQKSSTDKSEIHPSNMYTISRDGVSLRILKMNLDLVGKYTCEASVISDENHKISFTTDVQVTDLSPPVLQSTDPKFVTVHNNGITIPCKIVSGTPPPSVRWQVKRKGEQVFKDVSASGEELTLRSVSLADAGQYRCIATNAKGQANKTVEVIAIKAPEAVIDEGTAVTIPYGTTKVFKCRIVAYPLPKHAWTDSKGHKLQSKEFITDHGIISQLQVNNIKSNETYSCAADNDQGRTEARIRVSVAPAIVITKHPAETTVVKYKAPTNIYCDARSAFPIQMKWFYQKNDKYAKIEEIHTSDQYVITPDGSRLHIMSTDMKLIGNYTCEASLVSDNNEKTSFTTKLEIIDLQAPQIVTNDKNVMVQTVMNGQKLEASCKANGIPKPKVTWQFKAENSDAFTDIPSQGEVVTIPSISYEGAGAYKCKATNDVGSQSRIHNVVVHGAPKITNANDVYSGVTGDKVLLIPCEVSGVPEPSIIWKHEGELMISDEKLTIDKNKLFINNPTEKDNANFTCEARNKYGTAIKQLRAEISDFVDFDENLNTYIYLKIGESRDIKCNLPHSDPQSVRWYINKDKNFEQTSSYSIRDAKYSNDGNYTCRVNTDQGSKSLNYVVDVGYKPSFITPSSSPIITWNGNKEEILNCDVDAKPREKARWLHNGKPLDSAATELYISGYGWGEYTCIVSNVHGSVQQTFNVTSSGCVIDTTVNRVKNTPLLFGDQPLTWPTFYRENEYIVVKHKDNLTLTCSTEDQPRNTFNINPNAKDISMECYKEDQFTVEGKIYKFQDLECKNYVKTSLISTKKTCMKNGEIKKVGFKLSNGILGVYDICYSDADHRILYTKVLMSDANLGNKVGPSFQLNQGIKTSKHVGDLLKCQYNQRLFVNPKDVAFGPAQISTLENKYNSVLVYEPCEDSSRITWSDVEKTVSLVLEDQVDKFTLWTGASNYDKNGRPRYLWKLAKFDDDEFEAIVYVNSPNPDSTDILCSKYTPDKISLPDTDQYTYSCTIDELLEAFKLPLSDFGITFK